MTRLMVLVEGETEEAFINNVLAPYLRLSGVECTASRVTTRRKGHTVHKGGGVRYERVKGDILRWMKEDQTRWVSTMFDLYALPCDFPESAAAARQVDPYKRAQVLESALSTDIVDDSHWRFVPYIQLHEYEAILYCDLVKLREWYHPAFQDEIDQLSRSVASFQSPEHIDDGPQTAPSKRIIQSVPRYRDEKRVVGPAVAERIGLGCIRDKCTHFSQWLDRLEKLTAAA